jgi:hypothetical protein
MPSSVKIVRVQVSFRELTHDHHTLAGPQHLSSTGFLAMISSLGTWTLGTLHSERRERMIEQLN